MRNISVSKASVSSIEKIKYAAVILAAGESRRAGGYKPLWPLDGAVVIDRVIEAASSVCSRIRVVGGYTFARLKAHLEKLENKKVELVYNDKWERGMFSSVQIGLAGVDTPAFIHPADIFGVSVGVYAKLVAEVEDLHSIQIFRPQFGRRAGHPILIMPSVVTAVCEASDKADLREILRSFADMRDVQVDDEFVLEDFDTAVEFEKLKEKIRGKMGQGAK